MRFWWLAIAMAAAPACREPDAPTPAQAQAQEPPSGDEHAAPPDSVPAPSPASMEGATDAPPPPTVTVHDAASLPDLDLTAVKRLDLALSDTDRLGLPPDGRTLADRCGELDLLALSARLPALTELRLSGCQSAAHTGLGALGDRLRQLELADLALDGVTIGRISQLRGLRDLQLSRVTATEDSFGPLAALPIQSLALRELEIDSRLAGLAALWPRDLRQLRLEGTWAAHETMLAVTKATNLEVLELIDTRIGNFSLNQVKRLTKLREVDFRGQTFNDNTPLYVRNLPLERFSCACPRMGDAGVRTLRFVKTLRALELAETRVSGPGLSALSELEGLERVTIEGTALSPEGLVALATFPRLRALILRGPGRAGTDIPDLGQLTELEELVLTYPHVDDRAVAKLAPLRELRRLDLGGTAVSDDGLRAVGSLVGLQRLALHHTRVTNRGLAHLAKLTKLEILELDHCDILDAGVAHLAGLPALRELRLDSTLVTDAVVDTLLTLPALERLNLARTVVSDDGADRLGAHPNLRTLNLQGTRVATSTPAE